MQKKINLISKKNLYVVLVLGDNIILPITIFLAGVYLDFRHQLGVLIL